jgi:hypothetical protein
MIFSPDSPEVKARHAACLPSGAKAHFCGPTRGLVKPQQRARPVNGRFPKGGIEKTHIFRQ